MPAMVIGPIKWSINPIIVEMNAISLLLANTRHHPTIIISITTNNEFRPDSRNCGVFFCFFTLAFLFFGASIIGNTRHILKTTARRCQQIAAKNKLKQTTDTRRMMTSSWKQKNQTVGVIIDIIHMPGPGRLVNRQRTMMATIISTVQARHGSESCGLANRWLAKASKGLRFALIWVTSDAFNSAR